MASIEELWTDCHGPERKFYQGLIQVAVALHHFGNGNIRGAKKLFLGCQRYLVPYRPKYLGLNVDKLLADLGDCFVEVMATSEEFPKITLDPERIPEIHLDPPPPA
jgi:predicted metal-dependent hydrolase